MQKFRFNFVTLTILAAISLGCLSAHAYANSLDTRPTDEQRYQQLAKDYREADDQHKALELIASGTAATLVGVYGYYFDERGVLAKLAYAGTQTAGILVIGEGIRRYNSISTISALDQTMTSSGGSESVIKRALVLNHEQQKRAKQRADAWTAGLLGGLYMYNAVRTPASLKSVRNVFLFLSFNAIAVSGYNSYMLYHEDETIDVGVRFTGNGATLIATF